MFAVLLSLICAGSAFDIRELDTEMSMDTYEFGIDASPMVKTFKNTSPTIDSLVCDTLYGRLEGRKLIWNKKGECVSPLCKPNEELTWSDLWKPL